MLVRSDEVFNDFWYWINERQMIYLNKEAGKPKPWSDDPIFQNWKFCNVFRTQDKQTKLLLQNVINPHKGDDKGLLLFNIFVFRAFNWWSTYNWLVSNMGVPFGEKASWIDSWDPERMTDVLYTLVGEENQKLTSGAYMIRGREGMPKYESIVQTLTNIWEAKDYLIEAFTLWPSMENAQASIMGHQFWGWGPFTTYQVVLDLTYTNILPNPSDINTWCEFGPGAQRGISLIYPGISRKEMLPAAIGLYEIQDEYRASHVDKLTLQDVEFSLCELSKMERLKAGGKSKEHYNAR